MKIVILGLSSDLYFKSLQSLLPEHHLSLFNPLISLNAYDSLILIGDDLESLFSTPISTSSSADFLDLLPDFTQPSLELQDESLEHQESFENQKSLEISESLESLDESLDSPEISESLDKSPESLEKLESLEDLSEKGKKRHWLIEKLFQYTKTKIFISNTIDDICAEYLNSFDHFFIADKSLLLRMQRRYGSQYVHYLPDIRFKNSINYQKSDFDLIGIFTNDPLPDLNFNYPIKYIKDINKIFYKKITYAICFDQDTILICNILKIPFIAIGAATASFCQKIKYQYWLPSFDQNLIKMIEEVKRERVNIEIDFQKSISEAQFLLETNQLNALLGQKRVPFEDLIERIDFDKMYASYQDKFLQLTNQLELSNFIDQLCFEITNIPISKYIPLLQKKLKLGDLNSFTDHLLIIIGDFINETRLHANRLNLTYLHQTPFVEIHRSGWNFVCSHLNALNCPNGILFDTYCEQTFQTAAPILSAKGIIPYSSPWIGILHYTFNTEYTPYSLGNLFAQSLFLKSLPTCYGFICLSDYLSNQVRTRLNGLKYEIPVLTLYHPTEFPSKTFSIERFCHNPIKRIISIGFWYRNPLALYLINTPSLRKTIFLNAGGETCVPPSTFTVSRPAPLNISSRWLLALYSYLNRTNYCLDRVGILPSTFSFEISTPVSKRKRAKTNLQKFKRYLELLIKSVEIMPKVDNDRYDLYLTENIVFLNLVDASASNAIIECIVRNTPIIVNRLPACEEYLGKDYPLFYDHLEQVESLTTLEKIREGYCYLKNMNKEFLRIEYMIAKLKQSDFYKNLICH